MLSQLRRATEKIGALNIKVFSEIYCIQLHAHGKEYKHLSSSLSGCFQIDNASYDYHDFRDIFVLVTQINFKSKSDADQMQCNVAESPKTTRPSGPLRAIVTDTNPILEAKMKEDTCSNHIAIPEDFRCPITLELMRDPVIVSTGQV